MGEIFGIMCLICESAENRGFRRKKTERVVKPRRDGVRKQPARKARKVDGLAEQDS